MKQLLALFTLALALSACDKDKVETKPHVTFKSFDKDVVQQNDQTLRVTLEFTDQEGDLDSVFITRQRLNRRGPSYLDFPYAGIPQFGNQSRGELFVTLPVQEKLVFNLTPLRIPGSNPERYEPDTLQLRFYVKDKEGNVSDTASAKQLIVIR